MYSIYIKRRLDAQYVKIFGPDNVTSAVDVVTAARNPLAFFNVMVASPGSILEGKSTGFNWSHVGQIDLATGSVSVAVAAAMAPQCAFRSVFHGIVLPRRRRAVRAVMEDEIVPALDALGLGASHAWRARRRGS